MKAVTLNDFDTAPVLREDLPAPTPAANEVLVRVRASSVNPADTSIASGMLKQMGVEYEFPVILGRDYVGVVEQVGSDVTRYRVGDAVFGFLLHANPTAHDGSWAELIAVPQDMFIGRAPEAVDVAIAGAAPLAGITAMLAIDALELSNGDTLLIVGATGGVGSLAVQLAARAGATVVAPALPEDEAYLHELGVSELLPRDGDLAAARRPGISRQGERPRRLAHRSRRRGPRPVARHGGTYAENLERLARLLADGTLRLHIQDTYELAQAPAALTALGTTHTQGKLAIRAQ